MNKQETFALLKLLAEVTGLPIRYESDSRLTWPKSDFILEYSDGDFCFLPYFPITIRKPLEIEDYYDSCLWDPLEKTHHMELVKAGLRNVECSYLMQYDWKGKKHFGSIIMNGKRYDGSHLKESWALALTIQEIENKDEIFKKNYLDNAEKK